MNRSKSIVRNWFSPNFDLQTAKRISEQRIQLIRVFPILWF